MRIALGTDHAGFGLKEAVKRRLQELGHQVVDFGCFTSDSCDYPDFVGPAARAVGSGDCDRAVVFGGSGNGEAIVANKIPGVRCALCWNRETAVLAREHNDANVLSFGARQVGEPLALAMLEDWLQTPFSGGRHARRVTKIGQWEGAPVTSTCDR